ncbi:MAG: hypothetical protein NVSMB62_02940 [Acidobacteriaceae bacterium]
MRLLPVPLPSGQLPPRALSTAGQSRKPVNPAFPPVPGGILPSRPAFLLALPESPPAQVPEFWCILLPNLLRVPKSSAS